MFLSISIDRVLEKVYALSALNAIARGETDGSGIISAYNGKALREVMKGAFIEVVMALRHHVTDTNLGEADDETEALTMSITMAEQTGSEAGPIVRGAIEEAMALRCMAMAGKETADEARRLTAVSDEYISAANRICAGEGTNATIMRWD